MIETGERMLPHLTPLRTFWEHMLRYRFAAHYARGKDVLDIACGEGYGTAGLMAAGAKSVIGFDIAPDAVEHARQRYSVDARVGSALAVPLPDESADLLVSFETIEHLPDPIGFIAEIARLLRPGGQVIISTPEKEHYHLDGPNPHHVHELSHEEFRASLKEHFEITQELAQTDRISRWFYWSRVACFDLMPRVKGGHRIRAGLTRWLNNQSAPFRENPQAFIAGSNSAPMLTKGFVLKPLAQAKKPTFLVAVARKR